MSDWNIETGTATTTTWTRSWRQELFTDLDTDFRIVYHMESVTKLDTGQVIHTPLPQVTRQLSQVKDDPDVIALGIIMLKLGKKWLDEDVAAANPPVVAPPIEIPPVEPPPVVAPLEPAP